MSHLREAAVLGAVLLAAGATLAAAGADERSDLRASTGLHVGAGAGFGALIGPSATGEVLYGFGADVRDDGERVKGVLGVLVQAHAGADGGKLSLGVGGRARIDSDDWKGMAALNVKLSLARTWRDDSGARRTYFGPEMDFCVKHVSIGLGPLWKLSGGGSRLVFSWGIGVRL